jgi:hypothetical protein
MRLGDLYPANGGARFALMLFLLLLVVPYGFQTWVFVSMKITHNARRDAFAEMIRADLRTDGRDQNTSIGVPVGIPWKACDFWTFEYFRRDCFLLQIFVRGETRPPIDRVAAIVKNPCTHLDLLKVDVRPTSVRLFGCDDTPANYRVVVVAYRVSSTQHGSVTINRREQIAQFAVSRERGP